MHEKYAVVTDDPKEANTSLHGKGEGVNLERCPSCQSLLVEDPQKQISRVTRVCPECGTKPFER